MTYLYDLIYTYLIFNLLLVVSYGITRLIHLFFTHYFKLSQKEQLNMLKSAVILFLSSFIILPQIFYLTANTQPSSFQIQPFLKQSTTELLTLSNTPASIQAFPILHEVAYSTISLGVTLFIVGSIFLTGLYYLRKLYQLKQIISEAYIYKKIGNITIFISEKISIPCCWSLLNKSYVCIPYQAISTPSQFNIYLLHELQHIRQRDPVWQHAIELLRVFCFWNPAISWWKNYFSVIQEYACDEQLLATNKVSIENYTHALVNFAQHILTPLKNDYSRFASIHFFSKRNLALLHTRTRKIINYHPIKSSCPRLIAIISLLVICFSSFTYAFNSSNKPSSITLAELQYLVNKTSLSSQINLKVTPNLVETLNKILASPNASAFVKKGIKNSLKYRSIIQTELQKNNLPVALLALPLAESGYVNWEQNSQTKTAGLWQFIPSTAQHFGLNTTPLNDQRQDPLLSTQAALKFLQSLHNQFGDWQLTLTAYHSGPRATESLIEQAKTHDIGQIIINNNELKGLAEYLSIVNAMIVLMHYPHLLN